MTDIPESSSLSRSAAGANAAGRLRLVLRANAATSLAGGVVTLGAGSWISRELGIDHVLLTRVIGAGLIAFAIQVLVVSRSRATRMLREAGLISLADATWVLGSIAVVASGVLSSTGNIVVALVAVGVGDFGIIQFLLRRRALSGGEPQIGSGAGVGIRTTP